MSWNYAYTPAIWPPVITILLLGVMSIYVWRRRGVPGALPLLALAFFSALTLVGAALKVTAVDPAAKIAAFLFRDMPLLAGATAEMCFVLEYVWPGRWLTRRNLALLALPALLAILLEIVHGGRWMWRVLEVGPDGVIVSHLTLAGILFTVYGLGLFLVNLAALLWLFIRSPQHRWPVVIMLIAQAIVRVPVLLKLFHLTVLPQTVVDIATILLTWTSYTLALFGFRILDPVGLAHQTLIEQLSDGVLVLDRQGRIAGLNPVAQRIFQMPEKEIKDRPVQEILPVYQVGVAAVSGETETEFSRGEGAGASRSYALTISPLNDWRGQEVGRLLLCRDVTEQKMAQAKIVEQQSGLAMLHEREQLARELHDSLGQVLGYAGFQLEAVQGRIQDGQVAISASLAQNNGLASAIASLAEAGSQLARLSSIVEEAHADVREHILNLRLSPSEERPFFATLHQYLDGFSQNYGLPAALSVGPEISEGLFDPGAQMQLYRIIQEALSNARKHAGASRLQVTFAAQNGQVRVTIQDNGRGFDLAEASPGDHFGLRFMRERAEEMGWRLAVISQPGEGTCVEVVCPS